MGEEGHRYQDTLAYYGKTLDKAVPYFTRLGEFTNYKNKMAFETTRNNILQRVGLVYSDFFNEQGKYIGEPKPSEPALIKCLNLNITLLSPNDLTSDTDSDIVDPNNLGITKAKWFRKGSFTQIFTKIITTAIFGYYTLILTENFDWGSLIWKILQVSMFILMGLWQLFQAFQFINGEYRNRLIKKTNLLDEAIDWSNANKVEITPKNIENDALNH